MDLIVLLDIHKLIEKHFGFLFIADLFTYVKDILTCDPGEGLWKGMGCE